MASTKEAFGSNNQSLTCTLTSLGNGNSRQSTYVDNTTNLFLDALVFFKIKSASSAVSATGSVGIYAYASVDGASTFTDGATGTDGSITPTSPTNLRAIGIINMVAVSTTYYGGPFSVAAAFGGTLPAAWGIVVTNSSGASFDATTASAYWQGVYSTTA